MSSTSVCLQHASSDVERMVLGNKCDMNDKRQVSKERGEKVRAPNFIDTTQKHNDIIS